MDRNVISDVERSEAKKKLQEMKNSESESHPKTLIQNTSTITMTASGAGFTRTPAKQNPPVAFSKSLPTDESWKPLPKAPKESRTVTELGAAVKVIHKERTKKQIEKVN